MKKTQEQVQKEAQELITYNINVIYHLSAKYTNINFYLKGNVRKTLLKFYGFMKGKQIIKYSSKRYIFVIDNKRITQQVRKKLFTETSTFRYMSVLCALGFLKKIPQDKRDPDNLLQVNRNFFHDNPEKRREITVFSFRRYDDRELARIETRAERLSTAGVRIGNISYNMLMLNGCEKIAKEVYTKNNPTAPDRKCELFEYLLVCIDMAIEGHGYAYRQEIVDNLLSMSISEQEIDMLFKLFRSYLLEEYNYKRPNREQKKQFNLTSDKYIYTPKQTEKEGNR